MFEDGAAVVGAAVFGQDGVVHDAEGDVVDHVVWDFLFYGSSSAHVYIPRWAGGEGDCQDGGRVGKLSGDGIPFPPNRHPQSQRHCVTLRFFASRYTPLLPSPRAHRSCPPGLHT